MLFNITSIIPPVYSYLFGGLLGAITGGLLGWQIRNDFLRWILAFAMLGMIGSALFAYLEATRELKVYAEIKFFIPIFTIIGSLIGELIRRKDSSNNWYWVPAFALLGASGALISQMRGEILLLIPMGLLIGAVAWQVTNPKTRWVLALSLFCATMSSWTLLSNVALSSHASHIVTFALSGTLATAISWKIDNNDTRWVFTLALVGAMFGSLLQWSSIVSSSTLLLGAAIGTITIWLILSLNIPKAVIFMTLGILALCWIVVLWDIINFWENIPSF